MTDLELLSLNEIGFIPGPTETLPLFVERVEKTKKLLEEVGSFPPAHWDWPRERLEKLFGFKPCSLPAFYSDKNLSLWQGAACWVDQENIPILQLRNGFIRGNYLKIYSREEVLAHEAAHAARAAFDEPENEEFFAYATAGVKWRSILGPLIRNNWEPWIVFGLFGLSFLFPLFFFISLSCIGAGFFRLCKQHLRLSKASALLFSTLKDKKKVRSFLFRLTDREIEDLSKGIWIKNDGSLRWRLIQLAYLDKVLPEN